MNLKYQNMYLDIQLGDGVILAELIEEKENTVSVSCLEETDNEGHYSFRSPVWISKEHIVRLYSIFRDIDRLGYEEVGDNLYISVDASDKDFVPSSSDDEEDEEDDYTSLCSDDSLN